MSVYVVAQFVIHHPEKFDRYVTESWPTIAASGGKVIARGIPRSLRGSPLCEVAAIVEFQDDGAAYRWMQSEEYRELVANRDESCQSRFFELDGFDWPEEPSGTRPDSP